MKYLFGTVFALVVVYHYRKPIASAVGAVTNEAAARRLQNAYIRGYDR